jgi:integrase
MDPTTALAHPLAELTELAHGYLQEATARRTRKAYLADRAVALVVQRAVAAAGLDATRFAGHSLRAGLAASAAMAGVEERQIAQQTGHRSMTVLRHYIRHGELFRQNAAAAVGL